MTLARLQAQFSGVTPADFTILLERVTGKNRAFLLAHPEFTLTPPMLRHARAFLRRRARQEPIAYILKEKEFYGRVLSVTQNTLIPRPETELMIEECLNTLASDFCNSKKKADIVDLGTGTGNIIITLALEHSCRTKHLSFFASDQSKKTLRIAQQNADRYKVKKKIFFSIGDLLLPYVKKNVLRSSALIIVANLPYVSPRLFQNVSRDIRDYEPREALLSPDNGLRHYHRLLVMIAKLPRKQTILFLEISPEQKTRLREKVRERFPDSKITFLKDLAGRARLAKISLS